MISSIIRSDEGYEILVDGQPRTFRDVKAAAYEAAGCLKTVSRYKERIEVVERATGKRIEIEGLGH
jgi:hypothetical protein